MKALFYFLLFIIVIVIPGYIGSKLGFEAGLQSARLTLVWTALILFLAVSRKPKTNE